MSRMRSASGNANVSKTTPSSSLAATPSDRPISRIGAPITVPSPPSGRISPSSDLIVVVLPAPLRPT